MKNNLNKSLREKEVEKKKKIYIKVQIDRAATSTLAATNPKTATRTATNTKSFLALQYFSYDCKIK
jgi:hypothetical protein